MQQYPTGFQMLSNAAATSAVFDWPGGKGFFAAQATWGGGNVKLQFLGPDGTNYIDYPSGSLSANGGLAFQLPPVKIKAAVATATAVYASANWVPE